MVKVTSLLAKAGSGLRFRFGVRAWTEMEIQCVKGMHRLKLVSSENNSIFKGLKLSPPKTSHGYYHSKVARQPVPQLATSHRGSQAAKQS